MYIFVELFLFDFFSVMMLYYSNFLIYYGYYFDLVIGQICSFIFKVKLNYKIYVIFYQVRILYFEGVNIQWYQ